MGNTNTLGFGSLASVAWTDMNGTGLSPTQLTDVNAKKDKSELIATALLNVIQGAVNKDLTSFRLSDLFDPPATAPDWATFIGTATGKTVGVAQSLSLSQWRGIAAELQDYAALQASKRPTSDKGGGGIKNVNGHWYVNGQQLSLLDVYMAVRVNQVSNFDDSLQIYINELTANNRLVKAANDWLGTLRAGKPTATDGSSALAETTITAFKNKWGYDPLTTFMPKYTNAVVTASQKQMVWDQYIEQTKSYVDTKDSDNQTVQQKLEQMTNRRSEVLDGLTSFAKSQSQTGSSFARNLG